MDSAHIYPIDSLGSPKSQPIESLRVLGVYCTNEVLTTSPEGVGRAI